MLLFYHWKFWGSLSVLRLNKTCCSCFNVWRLFYWLRRARWWFSASWQVHFFLSNDFARSSICWLRWVWSSIQSLNKFCETDVVVGRMGCSRWCASESSHLRGRPYVPASKILQWKRYRLCSPDFRSFKNSYSCLSQQLSHNNVKEF